MLSLFQIAHFRYHTSVLLSQFPPKRQAVNSAVAEAIVASISRRILKGWQPVNIYSTPA